jgi:PAS domain S-box-containing protein
VAGQLAHLVEASPVLIGVGRVRDATLTYISPNVERILGYPPEDVVHTAGWFLDHVHPDDLERARSMGGDIRARRPSYTGELRFRRADGTYTWFLVSIRFTYRLGSPTTGVVYMLDVSDQVEARLTRRQLEGELEQARHLESLGKLAGGVAHDFNNLLAVILNYSDFVAASLPSPPPPGLEETWTRIQHDVEEITRAAHRGRDLTRRLLTFARRDVSGSEVMCLNDALGAVEGLLTRVLGDRCQVEVSFDPDLPKVRLDAGQLEQVVLNLAINARDAMPDGGRLRIATRRDETEMVRLEVSDTGAGMSEEVRQRAFEPFFTTKAKGQGTGLGLAIVHGIVTTAGGSISIESVPGRGTTFRILLPAALEEAAPPEPTARRPGAGERVLLVEDEPAVREITRRLLAANGYQVEVAADPLHALSVVADPEEPLDLLLTDVVMPEMSGPELAEQARHRRPGLKLLFMSGYAHGLLPPQGVLGPGVALLDKPFTEFDLLSRVREVLDGSS